MMSLSGPELRRIERQFAEGIRSQAVVEIFRSKGHRFSEATLRKYVQLGLLPKSRRVGVRGRHRGSSGLYPVSIVRLVNDIKRALEAGATLEEVRFCDITLGGEIDQLRRASHDVISRFREAVQRLDDRQRRSLVGKRLEAQRRAMAQSFRELERLATRLGRRPS
jgi:DNA-binding transcriptional MerR regulator